MSAEMKLRLQARARELEALVRAGRQLDQPVAPDKAIGRLTRQDALQQQQMSAELIRRYEGELVRVRQALQRLGDGT